MSAALLAPRPILLTPPPPSIAPRMRRIHHLRVLVVEDEPVCRLRLVRTIQRLGHDVLVATDGLQAWQLFDEQGADVIITDWLMPGLEGPELCQRVRAHAPDEAYPYVIFSTVRDGLDHIAEAIGAGADDYFIKPTSSDDIEAGLIVAERVTQLHRRRVEEEQSRRATLRDAAGHASREPDPNASSDDTA